MVHQVASVAIMLLLGGLMVASAALHDNGRPRLAPVVRLLAALFVASTALVLYAYAA